MDLLVRAWILLSTLLVAGGWILSAAHELNRAGYLTLFTLSAAAIAWYWRNSSPPPAAWWRRAGHKLCRRFRRPLPLLFAMLALMALAAGTLYCPYDSDSDTYRIPRVFHWLGQQQWHWIHADDRRLNIAGAGFEWLAAPIMLFTGNDWPVFLINWISYLLLPGLIFSVFIRLGVRRLVAWNWMWVLATGWCFTWQAQTTTNDGFAAIYALASVDFALRARRSGRLSDWWLAVLAAALLTGPKQTNLPLALVPAIILLTALRPVFARPLTVLATLAILAVGLLVSAVPTSILNWQHTGNWLGAAATDPEWAKCVLPSPLWGALGNTFCLTVQNVKPPLFPLATAWNSAMQHFLQTPFGSHFNSFEDFARLDRSVDSDNAALGLFICGLTVLSIVWAARLRATEPTRASGTSRTSDARDCLLRWLWLAPWMALLVFMAKNGAAKNGRQLAPYYILLFPLLLTAAGHVQVVRRIWWQRLAVLVALGTAGMVATSRSCPLFPARTIFGWLHEHHPQSHLYAQLLGSYSCHDLAEQERQAFKAELPPGETVLGYLSSPRGIAEPGHWEPFGTRQVERIVTGETPASVRSRRIHYIMVDGEELSLTSQPLAEWLRRYDAEVVSQIALTPQYGEPPIPLYLVHLHP